MNQETFGKHDLLTVGETWDATPEIAKLYSNPERNEFSMIFQFEHITLTWKHGDKWNPTDLDLKKFKQVLTKWQVELADEAGTPYSGTTMTCRVWFLNTAVKVSTGFSLLRCWRLPCISLKAHRISIKVKRSA